MLKKTQEVREAGRRRHNEEQIISILKEADAGVNINEVCRKNEISNATYYRISGTLDLPGLNDLIMIL